MDDTLEGLEKLFDYIRRSVEASPDVEITAEFILHTDEFSDDGYVVCKRYNGWVDMTFKFFDKNLVDWREP